MISVKQNKNSDTLSLFSFDNINIVGLSTIAEKSSSFPFSRLDGARCDSDIEIFLPACLPEKSAFLEEKIFFWLKRWKVNVIFSDQNL